MKLVTLTLLIPVGLAALGAHAQNPDNQKEKSFDQAQALSELRKQIAGQENQPAEKVFKNIELLKGMPAARVLAMMEIGFSRALGVDCTHCHVAGQWDKEDKPTKQIAREMFQMMMSINNDHLKNIRNLKSASPVVNCTTCHRGQTKPATNLPVTLPIGLPDRKHSFASE